MIPMRLFLETSDPAVIAPLMRWGAFAGVVPEPTWSGPVGVLVEAQPGDLFVALDADTADALEARVRSLSEAHPSRVTFALPPTEVGLEVIHRLRDERTWIAAAPIVSLGQVILAANAGADLLSVELGRGGRLDVVADAVELCQRRGGRPRVTVTGVRSVEEVLALSRLAVWGASVSPEIARGLLGSGAAG